VNNLFLCVEDHRIFPFTDGIFYKWKSHYLILKNNDKKKHEF
jgi:hypothetical protein